MTLRSRLIPLLGGGLVGQLLQVSAIPLLTRMYGPERYGEYGLFAAALLFTGMLATLRYELAVQLPKKESVANCVAMLAIFISAVISILTFVVALIVFTNIVVIEHPWNFSFVLALSTFFLASFNVLAALALRSGNYKISGFSRVVQIAVGVISALVFYYYGFSFRGLLYANALGYLVGALVLLVAVFDNKWLISWRDFLIFRALRIVARRYSGFALFNAPQALMDGMRPIFVVSMIQQHYGVSDVGRYHIANQLLQTPAGLIGQAFSQIHFRALVESGRALDISTALKQTLGVLCLIAVAGVVSVFVFSDPLVDLLFGSKWSGLGLTLRALVALVAINLIVGPLVFIFHARRKHKEFLFLGAGYNLISIGSIWLGSYYFVAAADALRMYAVMGSIALLFIGARSIWLTLDLARKA